MDEEAVGQMEVNNREDKTDNSEPKEGYTEQEQQRPKKKRGGMRNNPFYADL